VDWSINCFYFFLDTGIKEKNALSRMFDIFLWIKCMNSITKKIILFLYFFCFSYKLKSSYKDSRTSLSLLVSLPQLMFLLGYYNTLKFVFALDLYKWQRFVSPTGPIPSGNTYSLHSQNRLHWGDWEKRRRSSKTYQWGLHENTTLCCVHDNYFGGVVNNSME
jgi:hypothetical protein